MQALYSASIQEKEFELFHTEKIILDVLIKPKNKSPQDPSGCCDMNAMIF